MNDSTKIDKIKTISHISGGCNYMNFEWDENKNIINQLKHKKREIIMLKTIADLQKMPDKRS